MEMNHINNIDFAKRLQTLEGEVPFDALQRLNALLAMDGVNAQSKIKYQLVGQIQKYQLPSLHLYIDASLPMLCQRCLESMQIPIKLQFDYVISAEMPESLDAIDDMDWVEASVDMDLQALIEDELLIALPIAPVHASLCKQLKFETGEKVNPFSVLKSLKKD
ncbi:MAG: hypothetical protein B7X95_05710 [Methylophilaceae bacterium 17-44-8]|jgi:uncharacterized protein|nr:MAG: hypothetical protein B7Y48_02355 [Methylophilales bacterium 28-44-11]OZA05621.1 MAG: hypothetical protein B7X95_05710 [Methylophilaceae bacterium 17-44-8]